MSSLFSFQILTQVRFIKQNRIKLIWIELNWKNETHKLKEFASLLWSFDVLMYNN